MHCEDTSDFRVHVLFLYCKKIADVIRNKVDPNLKKDDKIHPVQNHGVATNPIETVYI